MCEGGWREGVTKARKQMERERKKREWKWN
jgi:hypothetical protein